MKDVAADESAAGDSTLAARVTEGKWPDGCKVERRSGVDYIGPAMAELPVTLPDNLTPFRPTAERQLRVFGAPVELALIPQRRDRQGAEHRGQPPFVRTPAQRIIDEESYWRRETLALTPNKYPFARGQRILWMAHPAREPDETFWRALLEWVDRSGGTALVNNIGAAATIPRAHAHLTAEQLPFLPAVDERPLTRAVIDVPASCELVVKDLPCCVLGVRGPSGARTATLRRLADARLTAAWNVVATPDATWLVPRTVETPTPHFPSPMGAAEFWGRFCYMDESPFLGASADTLRSAWEESTAASID